METQEKRSTWLIALVVVGTVLTGVLGLLAAFVAFFSVDFSGVGLSLLASALAFGLLAKAVLPD